MDPFAFLESVISRDVGPDHDVGRLAVGSGDLKRACRHLAHSSATVVIYVGGPLNPHAAAMRDVDDPLGAVSLASALSSTGREVTLAAGSRLAPALRDLCAVMEVDARVVSANSHYLLSMAGSTDLVLVGCRPVSAGRVNCDVRAQDLVVSTASSAGVDQEKGLHRSIAVVRSLHDVGTERVSMSLPAEIEPTTDTQSAATFADDLIVCGASNWGAWALVAGVAELHSDLAAPARAALAPEFVSSVLGRLADLFGAPHDEAHRIAGFEWGVHLSMLASISHLLDPGLSHR